MINLRGIQGGGGGRSYREYFMPVNWSGVTLMVPFLVEREDGAHVIRAEVTDQVVARVRRERKDGQGHWRGQWTTQMEGTGEVLDPPASTLTDALFDLAQRLASVKDPALGRPEQWI